MNILRGCLLAIAVAFVPESLTFAASNAASSITVQAVPASQPRAAVPAGAPAASQKRLPSTTERSAAAAERSAAAAETSAKSSVRSADAAQVQPWISGFAAALTLAAVLASFCVQNRAFAKADRDRIASRDEVDRGAVKTVEATFKICGDAVKRHRHAQRGDGDIWTDLGALSENRNLIDHYMRSATTSHDSLEILASALQLNFMVRDALQRRLDKNSGKADAASIKIAEGTMDGATTRINELKPDVEKVSVRLPKLPT